MIALDELVKLPAEERIQIIEVLERSLEEEGYDDFVESPELIAEIMRRDAEFRADPSIGIPWETVKARILERRG